MASNRMNPMRESREQSYRSGEEQDSSEASKRDANFKSKGVSESLVKDNNDREFESDTSKLLSKEAYTLISRVLETIVDHSYYNAGGIDINKKAEEQ